MAIDRVLLEILRNHYQAVVEDMARIMERTAYTTFVKETADFSTGLVSTGGEYVAYPWNLGASSYLGLNMAHTLDYFDRYDEGDIVICNDAYLSGPLCTHLPDVHILRPIFHEGPHHLLGLRLRPLLRHRGRGAGQRVAARHRDLPGGAAAPAHQALPGRRAPGGRQEPHRRQLPHPRRRTGATSRRWWRRSARATGACRRWSASSASPRCVEGIDAVLDYAEQRARAAIRKIPDGTYRFTEYMEDDLRSEVPIRIQVALTIEGDSIHLDFTGTDPQVGSALNIASHGVTHPFLCQAINAYIVTEDPGHPQGLQHPPAGTGDGAARQSSSTPSSPRRSACATRPCCESSTRSWAPSPRRFPGRSPRRAGGRDLPGGGLGAGSA